MHRQLRWTVQQMQFEGPEGKPDPYFFPRYRIDAPPEEKPEPRSAEDKAINAHDPASFSPPFDLEPDEVPEVIGRRPDLDKLRQVAQAEASAGGVGPPRGAAGGRPAS